MISKKYFLDDVHFVKKKKLIILRSKICCNEYFYWLSESLFRNDYVESYSVSSIVKYWHAKSSQIKKRKNCKYAFIPNNHVHVMELINYLLIRCINGPLLNIRINLTIINGLFLNILINSTINDLYFTIKFTQNKFIL